MCCYGPLDSRGNPAVNALAFDTIMSFTLTQHRGGFGLTDPVYREIKFRVVKIRITDIVANTYYARIHLARVSDTTGLFEPGSEVDVDARPSDAINLAVRFGSPMYVAKTIAESAGTSLPEQPATPNESATEIVRSVRETLASFEDPTGKIAHPAVQNRDFGGGMRPSKTHGCLYASDFNEVVFVNYFIY